MTTNGDDDLTTNLFLSVMRILPRRGSLGGQPARDQILGAGTVLRDTLPLECGASAISGVLCLRPCIRGFLSACCLRTFSRRRVPSHAAKVLD